MVNGIKPRREQAAHDYRQQPADQYRLFLFAVITRRSFAREVFQLKPPFIRTHRGQPAGSSTWSLIWTSEPLSLSDARKLENRLKRQKRRSRLQVSNRTAKLVRLIIPQCGIPGSNPGPATNLTPRACGSFFMSRQASIRFTMDKFHSESSSRSVSRIPDGREDRCGYATNRRGQRQNRTGANKILSPAHNAGNTPPRGANDTTT